MARSFSANEFLTALHENRLKEPFLLTGMVKKADQPDTLLFAPGTSCENWLAVPPRMVEQVDWLGKVPCRDHHHDLVRLHLKEPDGPDAAVLAALLRSDPRQGTAGMEASANPIPEPLDSHPWVRVPQQPHFFSPASAAAVESLPEALFSPFPTFAWEVRGAVPASGDPGLLDVPTEVEPYPGLLAFPTSTFSLCTPSYGRWCGNCRTASPETPPLDAVDAVCKQHDLCIAANGHLCDCDAAFISRMTAAVVAPGVSAAGRAYGLAAIAAFQLKPCFCWKTVFGRRFKVWGFRGRCLF